MKLIQKCQVSDTDFSKPWLMHLLELLPPDRVNRLCREISHLNAHYDQTVGLRATDRPDKIWDNALMFDIEPIDFDSPVTFKKIS